ncbi:hypothetical protein ACFQ07_13720, partial [Actinomadura adrarensis]
DAAGVDLSTALDSSGRLTTNAAQKLDQYRQTVDIARNPTHQLALALQDAGNQALSLKDRMTALQTALEAQFNPSLAAYQATLQLREGFRALAEQMAKTKGGMSGNTAESLRLQQAFATQLTTVRDLYTATFQKTRSTQQAANEVNRYLPILYALAGRNKEARAQVDALARVTGFNVQQTHISRQAFIQQATAMLGSRAQAEALWASYVKLAGATNNGAASLQIYITRVR